MTWIRVKQLCDFRKDYHVRARDYAYECMGINQRL